MGKRGCWETRKVKVPVEGGVSWGVPCSVPFEGVRQRSGRSDLFPRKSYHGKMFMQANLFEESPDPNKTFKVSGSLVKFVGFSSLWWCMWILDIFLGKLNQAGGQVMSGLHSVILVTVFSCRVCNLEAYVIRVLLLFSVKKGFASGRSGFKSQFKSLCKIIRT